MEPPAVSSCGPATTSNGTEKSRRPAAEYLQIDASSSYNTSRNYEDLPENFLETISPQSNAPPSSVLMNDHAASPQLASLAPMSMASDQSSTSYMMSMNQYPPHSSLEKTRFGNGPAGLLSPLQLDSRRTISGATEFGVGPHVYIKEENDPLDGNTHHILITQQMSQQQEMDRIEQAETPPAVSNVELASTMIASLIGEQDNSSPSPHSYSTPSSSNMQATITNIKHDSDESLEGRTNGHGDAAYSRPVYNMQQKSQIQPRRVYSTKDNDDPLNREIDDDVYIDTKELCRQIAYELKQHSIPQAIFAERILCRSQGTLSDLLRNPKPWNKLKSGRETFRRMWNWVQQPLAMRLGVLDMYKQEGDDPQNGIRPLGMTPPTPAQNVRHNNRRAMADEGAPSNKRPRLVFTDIQKRTLQAIFKETQRPSREMQQTIAEHLRLDLSTVANFFMNARRRSRVGANQDEPAPYQHVVHVRPVTPPPDSPPRSGNPPPSRRRVPASMQHVEATVSSVAESAIQYSRDAAAQDEIARLEEEEQMKMYKNGDPYNEGIMVQRGVYDSGIDVEHCESLTPLGDSPVDVVDRGVVKHEENVLIDDGPSQ